MTLEQWQKATDIALKGVLATGLAIGTFLITRDQTNMNKSKLCGEMLQQNFDYVQANIFTDARKALLDAKLDVQSSICGIPDPKLVAMLNNSWRSATSIAEAMGSIDAPVDKGRGQAALPGAGQGEKPTAPSTPTTEHLEVEANLDRPQWVAVSRNNDSAYSAVNFDVVSGAKDMPNTKGNVLVARWFVNIRAKNTPVVNGDNPVIGQLLTGQCVRVDDAVAGTLNQWARVRRVSCPSAVHLTS